MFDTRQWIPNYTRLNKLGEGTYGEVWKAENVVSREIVAIKRVFMQDVGNEGIPSTTVREIALLKALDHANIVRLQETIYYSSNLFLVFAHFDFDLKKYFDLNRGRISMNEIKHYVQQILMGVEHCHSKRVYHRDLKPQNILIDQATKQIKLADFGLSRTIAYPDKSWTQEVITLWYRPPEILLGARTYSHTADIWSVACIFGEFCNANIPIFRGDSEICQLMYIFKNLGTPRLMDCFSKWQHFKHNAPLFPQWKAKPIKMMLPMLGDALGQDLVGRMLNLDPTKRISAKQCLRHPYFTLL